MFSAHRSEAHHDHGGALRRPFIVSIAVVAVFVLVAAPTAAAGKSKASPPAIALTPSTSGTYDYGTIEPGQSASQTFTLTNLGGTATGRLAIELSGSTAFAITADVCSATSLGPRKSCTVTVEYGPTAAGQSDSASLTASGKKPPSTATLSLTGQSTAPHIYWTVWAVGIVGRADVDGSNVDPWFISGWYDDVYAVAVDAFHIYWTNWYAGAIGRADLDGSNVDPYFIAGVTTPYGLAIDAGHIYWSSPYSYAIGRADLNGSNVDPDFITGCTWPLGMAIDAGHIYWANGLAIGRADLNGSSVNQAFIGGALSPIGVAVDAQYIYWGNYNEDMIARADLDGSNVDQSFITGASGPMGVAVDAGHVYWTNEHIGTIGRADLNGSNVARDFIPNAEAVWTAGITVH